MKISVTQASNGFIQLE